MKELLAIQSKLVVPKNQFNSHGGYKFRSCEDILEAIKPLLSEHDCFVVINDDIIESGGFVFIKATVEMTNSEGKTITSTAFARHADVQKGMQAAQITGSTSSYARKYALNGLFCIDDTKDADATNKHDKTPARQHATVSDEKNTVISKAKQNAFITAGKNSGYSNEQIKEALFNAGFKTSTDITNDKFQQLIDSLKNKTLKVQ